MKYDVILPIARKDAYFVHRTVDYIQKNLIEVENIYIITNKKNFHILQRIIDSHTNVVLLDEKTLLEGLSFQRIREYLNKYGADRITGWYFQQFLKLGFAKTPYANTYYLSWDADTIPLSPMKFEEDEKLCFDCKKEYHKPYFVPIYKLFGLEKAINDSFIAEHMLFEKEIVEEMIGKIENQNGIQGDCWWKKIITSCDYSQSLNSFSEFETYGTYAYSKNPNRYKLRHLATFRKGGLINGRFISDNMLSQLAFDLDTVSFELRDTPAFPLNIRCYLYRLWLKLKETY